MGRVEGDMCTSFIWRKDHVLAAMNFDNTLPFEICTKEPKKFIALAKAPMGKAPSFGVNSDGTFINHLAVDSNGKGLYRRLSKKVTHTEKLVGDILRGAIPPENISGYLNDMEIVNVPGLSVHNMISDRDGNTWVVEPGRGIIYSPAQESPYYLMTNFSLCDLAAGGNVEGSGADRYKRANELLEKSGSLNVTGAFKILKAVRQDGGEWRTAFSMVYTQKENTVYYCFDGDYENILKYSFA